MPKPRGQASKTEGWCSLGGSNLDLPEFLLWNLIIFANFSSKWDASPHQPLALLLYLESLLPVLFWKPSVLALGCPQPSISPRVPFSAQPSTLWAWRWGQCWPQGESQKKLGEEKLENSVRSLFSKLLCNDWAFHVDLQKRRKVQKLAEPGREPSWGKSLWILWKSRENQSVSEW